LGSSLTNDGRYTCEIKFSIAMAKAAFNKKGALFASTLKLKFKKLVNWYILSIVLCGAETWLFRAVAQKNLVSLKCGAGEG
jgi:hypothetical protein